MRTINLLIFYSDRNGQYLLIKGPGLPVTEDPYLLDRAGYGCTTVCPSLLAAVTQHLTERYCLQGFTFLRSWHNENTGHHYVLVESNQSLHGGSETSQLENQDTTSQVRNDSQTQQSSAKYWDNEPWNSSWEGSTTAWPTPGWDSDNSDSGWETPKNAVIWPTPSWNSEKSDSSSECSTINWSTPSWGSDDGLHTGNDSEPDNTWSVDSNAGSGSPPHSIHRSYRRKYPGILEAHHPRKKHAHRVCWAYGLHPWPWEYVSLRKTGRPSSSLGVEVDFGFCREDSLDVGADLQSPREDEDWEWIARELRRKCRRKLRGIVTRLATYYA